MSLISFHIFLLAHVCHSKFNNFVPLLPVLLPCVAFPGKKFLRYIVAIKLCVFLDGGGHGVFLAYLYPEILAAWVPFNQVSASMSSFIVSMVTPPAKCSS